MEYLGAEILELAGNVARDHKKLRINPRHLQLALRNDEELNKLLSGVIVAQGGVIPNVHPVLRPRRRSNAKPKSWIFATRLTHRGKVFGTYQTCPYAHVPKLTAAMLEPFTRFKTFDDLMALSDDERQSLLTRSVTDCVLELNPRRRVFYVDSQGCVIWYLNDDGTVGTALNIPAEVVASSLAEFLARMDLENRIWLHSNNYGDHLLTDHAKEYLALLEEKAPHFSHLKSPF